MRRGGGLLSGLLLIALGVVLLFNTLGLVDWRVWASLSRLWPLLLVLGGINLLFGGTRLGRLFVLVVVLVAAGMVWYGFRLPGGEAYALQLHEVAPPAAKEADYTLRFGGGRLRVAAAVRGTLISGEINARSPIERSVKMQGDVAHVTIAARGGHGWFQRAGLANWDVAVSPDLPATLEIDAGAAQLTLDLRQVPLEQLTLNSGAGHLNLQLGARAGTTVVDLHLAAADVDLEVPKAVGVRMTDTGLINSDNLERAGLVKAAGAWETPGYDEAGSRVEVHLVAAASHVDLNRVSATTKASTAAGSASGPAPFGVARNAVKATL